mgnify:CR=1 FL=1
MQFDIYQCNAGYDIDLIETGIVSWNYFEWSGIISRAHSQRRKEISASFCQSKDPSVNRLFQL